MKRWRDDGVLAATGNTLTRGAKAGNLRRLFGGLGSPIAIQGRVYETARIAPGSRYRIGRDREGNAVVLIETTGVAGAASLPDFTGRHLQISHAVGCAIREAGADVGRGQFSVVICADADDHLKQRFFEIIETILRSLGEAPEAEALRRVVAGLIELFRLTTQAPRGTIQGLWAELWVIAHAGKPAILLDAWHAEHTDVYDFNSGLERLEIKSAGKRVRRHHFSHRQLCPPIGTRAVIASLFVESSGRGPTISSLHEQIRVCVSDPRALMRLDHIVADILGTDWRAGIDASFDSELASESLQFYRANDVPSLPADTPRGISDIRYISDLSATEALTSVEMLGYGDLFAAVLPIDP